MRALRAAATLALALAAASPAIATAHAKLLSAVPAADAIISTLPTSFILVYDDTLRNDSSFVVLGPAGLTVTTGAIDPASVKTMIAPMPALPDGTYEVRWTTISNDDGFIERGSFKFKVALATAAPGGGPGAAGSSASSPASTATIGPGATGGAAGEQPQAGGDVVVPIAALAVLIGVGLAWFLRRRGPG